MGPYGPSVEARKELNLKTLKALYGDRPYEELRQCAIEESARRMAEYNAQQKDIQEEQHEVR
jgi:hypothetical protein